MDYNELKQAAKVFSHLARIRNYVSRERFEMVAKTQFGIEDGRKLDIMYGLLNMTEQLIWYIANEDNQEARNDRQWPEYLKLLPQTIAIAEAAFALRNISALGHIGVIASNTMPEIEYNHYRKKDKRRYFYQQDGKNAILDVDLGVRDGIILLGKLLQCEGVKIKGVARHLGYLEGKMKAHCNKDEHHYFEGDIYFLYADPTDRIFYDWYSHGDDAGVYLATDKGWCKLLYTPGRGYIDNKGHLQFMDEQKFYSNHMLEASGKGFRYIGNIHQDSSVLREKREE